jgi:hypothetical protein
LSDDKWLHESINDLRNTASKIQERTNTLEQKVVSLETKMKLIQGLAWITFGSALAAVFALLVNIVR